MMMMMMMMSVSLYTTPMFLLFTDFFLFRGQHKAEAVDANKDAGTTIHERILESCSSV
jgi:hypothetical protein